MYKRIILLLLTMFWILFGLSVAQETDPLEDSDGSGQVIEVGSGGQEETEVDIQQNFASGLDFTGNDISSLSGDQEFGTGDQESLSGVDLDSGTGDLESSTGNQESVPQPHLILSEVYFDGTDEWIEITNIGDGDFFGNIVIQGVKSSPLSLNTISILSGESKVFGDTLAQVSGNLFIGKTGLSLNMIDTSPINVSLYVSGQKVDEFLVDLYRVNLYNDKKTSFEKIGNIPTWTTSVRVGNALTGYTINPGILTVEEIVPINISFPPPQSGDNVQFPISCVSVQQTDLIKVSEIFWGNEKYPPYVELSIHDDISLDTLSISGNLLQTGVVFSWNSGGITLEKNSFFLLSSSGYRQDSEQLPGGQNDDFSLVITGNWLLITIGSGQNRQVMDIVYFSGEMLGESLYFSGSMRQCAHVLDSVDDFSPGFERKFLKYISGRTGTKIEYIYINTGDQSSGNLCQSRSGSNTISPETSAIFLPQNYTIKIVDVEYDPEGSDTDNEKVTLLAHHISGDTTPLDVSRILRLKVNGTKKTLPGILPMDVPTTFKKTFGFPNSTKDGSNVIIQLMYDEYIFDTYTYNPNTQKEEVIVTGTQLTGENTTGIFYDFSGMIFTITYVLPNPEGKDDKEEIGLFIYRDEGQGIKNNNMGLQHHVSGSISPIPEVFDLSQGFTLRRGNNKKKLSGIVTGGQENILLGNLGLVNKSACISLVYQEEELTQFCYKTPKEGEKIFASNVVLEEISPEDIDILNALNIKKIGNNLCVQYQDETFLCKRIPASKAEIKTIQEQKLYKGFSSLIKSYLMSDWKPIYYDTNIKRYYDLLSDSKKLIAKGYTQVDIYGQKIPITNIKQQFEVWKNTPLVIVAIFEGIKSLKIQ